MITSLRIHRPRTVPSHSLPHLRFTPITPSSPSRSILFTSSPLFNLNRPFARNAWKWASSTSHNPNLALAVKECTEKIKQILQEDRCNFCVVFSSNYNSTKKLIKYIEKAGFDKETIFGCTSNTTEIPFDKRVKGDPEVVLSITAASMPSCTITPFHVQSEHLPDMPINWRDFQKPLPEGESASLLLLVNRYCFEEGQFMRLMETAFPKIPKVGVAYGSRTQLAEKDIAINNTLVEMKEEAEEEAERRRTARLVSTRNKPSFPKKRSPPPPKKPLNFLVDSSLSSSAPSDPTPQAVVEANEDEYDDEDEDEDEYEDEDEDETGGSKILVTAKREMMFVKGRRYFHGAGGVLIQGPFRQTTLSSSLLSAIDKPKLITCQGEKLRIEDIAPTRFLRKLVAQHKDSITSLSIDSIFVAVVNRAGQAISKPNPVPIGSPKWWRTVHSQLQVGDLVQFYYYNGQQGVNGLIERMKKESVDFKEAGCLVFSSNIEPLQVSLLHCDSYRLHPDFPEFEDEEEAENPDQIPEEEEEEEEDDIRRGLRDDDIRLTDPDSKVSIHISKQTADRELSDSNLENFVKESLLAKSLAHDEEESDDEFEYTCHKTDMEALNEVMDDPPSMTKDDRCDEITQINRAFDHLPANGVYGLCTLSSSSPFPSILTSSIVLFEPPKKF